MSFSDAMFLFEGSHYPVSEIINYYKLSLVSTKN